MKRASFSLLFACALLVPGPATAAARAIQVANFAFAPSSTQAQPGDSLNWTWANGFHTVTAYQGASFASGMHPAPFSYQQTYPGGTLLYRCEIHSSLDPGGNCNGMCGAIVPFDTTPPPPPTISSPTDGASISEGSVTVRGTAPGDAATIRLSENGGELAHPSVTNNMWSSALTFSMGHHLVSAIAVDLAGNVSTPVSVSFTIEDLTPPPAPTIAAPVDGDIFSETRILIHGGASADAVQLRLYDGGVLKDTTDVVGGGWLLNESFTEGRHTITATALDAAGNESTPSESAGFLVDITPPDIAMTTPKSLDIVVGTLGFAGTASDNFAVATVSVRATDRLTGAIIEGGATCPGCGSGATVWSATLETGPGIFDVFATAVDEAGNRRPTSPVTVIVL